MYVILCMFWSKLQTRGYGNSCKLVLLQYVLRPEASEIATRMEYVLCVPSFMADPAVDGTRQSNFAIRLY
jgi:hypothetical protein